MRGLDRSDDDTSRTADLFRAIRGVERARIAALLVVGAALAVAAWSHGQRFATGVEVLLLTILVSLALIFEQLRALRVDAFPRELRNLPPAWPTS